jgi:predicted acylesterase/phospholipase RssA
METNIVVADNLELENQDEVKKNVVCRHIVIGGGAEGGFSFYGALKESSKRNLWNIENIKTIYGTSVGAIFGTTIALKYDWDVLDNYLINRPWHHIFKYDMYTIIESFKNRGILNIKLIEQMLEPLLSGKDLTLDVTLLEFYEWSGIEMHIMSTELLSFKLVDFSHKTHPDWRLIDAIYCSSSLPILMSPFYKDSKIYCDGGFLSNYPIEECIKNGADQEEILGLTREILKNESRLELTEESNLFDYIIVIFYKIIENFVFQPKMLNTKTEYAIPSSNIDIAGVFKTASQAEERIKLIDVGVNYVKNLYL